MKAKFRIVFLIMALLAGCVKKEYVSVGPPSPPGNNPPDDFIVSLRNVTDVQATLYWPTTTDPDHEPITYEIAQNDSIIAYNLPYFTTEYTVTGLQPNRNYTFTIYALDPERNARKVIVSLQTMKSLVQSVHYINLGHDETNLSCGIKTRDRGYIISGWCYDDHKAYGYSYFILKLNADLTIDWVNAVEGQFTSLHECYDGCILATQKDHVLKFDPAGNLMWNIPFPSEEKLNLTCVVDDADGSVFTGGFSNRHPSTDSVLYEYFIAKLTSTGSEQWSRFGGTTVLNEPHDIVVKPNGSLLVFGRAEVTGKWPSTTTEWETVDWLLNLDPNGMFVSQHFYSNGMLNPSDMPHSLYPLVDGAYWAFSTTFGTTFGYDSWQPRIVKIGTSQEIIWDQKYDLNSGGYNPSLMDYDVTPDGSLLLLSNDDEGENIGLLSSDGGVQSHLKLNGFPVGLLVRYLSSQCYLYIGKEGHIIILNSDGYAGDLKRKF